MSGTAVRHWRVAGWLQAAEYWKGHVLLPDDAARLHSPVGVLGLNLGSDDAINLGWKFAATVRGNPEPGLLDSYERERLSVETYVLDPFYGQVVPMHLSRSSRAQEAIIRDPGETRNGAAHFAERVWGGKAPL